MNAEWTPGHDFTKVTKNGNLPMDEAGTSIPFKIDGNWQVFNKGISYTDIFPYLVGDNNEVGQPYLYFDMTSRTTLVINSIPDLPYPDEYIPADGEGYRWELGDNQRLGVNGWNLTLQWDTPIYDVNFGVFSECYRVMKYLDIEGEYIDYPLAPPLSGYFHLVDYPYPPYPPTEFEHGEPYFAIIRRYFRDIQLYRIIIQRKVSGLNPFLLLLSSFIGDIATKRHRQ